MGGSTAAARDVVGRRRPLLVTGIPRAGTSWVGKMLEAGGRHVYVNEPLNPDHPPGRSPGVLNVGVPFEFLYVCSDNEARFLPAFRDTVALRYHPIAELRQNHTAYDVLRTAKYGAAFTLGRLQGKRAMLNDPFAPFSSQWLHDRLGFETVAIVRNAPAIVASYKRQAKTFDFRNLLSQPELMRDWLEPFRAEIEDHTAKPADVIDQISLLWRTVYHVIAELRDRGLPDFSVVSHEELSLDPIGEFADLYGRLSLPFTRKARETIEWGSLNPSAVKDAERPHVWTFRGGLSKTAFRPLDSRENLDRWRKYLTAEEGARVRDLTSDVAGRFYQGDEEWW